MPDQNPQLSRFQNFVTAVADAGLPEYQNVPASEVYDNIGEVFTSEDPERVGNFIAAISRLPQYRNVPTTEIFDNITEIYDIETQPAIPTPEEQERQILVDASRLPLEKVIRVLNRPVEEQPAGTRTFLSGVQDWVAAANIQADDPVQANLLRVKGSIMLGFSTLADPIDFGLSNTSFIIREGGKKLGIPQEIIDQVHGVLVDAPRGVFQALETGARKLTDVLGAFSDEVEQQAEEQLGVPKIPISQENQIIIDDIATNLNFVTIAGAVHVTAVRLGAKLKRGGSLNAREAKFIESMKLAVEREKLNRLKGEGEVKEPTQAIFDEFGKLKSLGKEARALEEVGLITRKGEPAVGLPKQKLLPRPGEVRGVIPDVEAQFVKNAQGKIVGVQRRGVAEVQALAEQKASLQKAVKLLEESGAEVGGLQKIGGKELVVFKLPKISDSIVALELDVLLKKGKQAIRSKIKEQIKKVEVGRKFREKVAKAAAVKLVKGVKGKGKEFLDRAQKVTTLDEARKIAGEAFAFGLTPKEAAPLMAILRKKLPKFRTAEPAPERVLLPQTEAEIRVEAAQVAKASGIAKTKFLKQIKEVKSVEEARSIAGQAGAAGLIRVDAAVVLKSLREKFPAIGKKAVELKERIPAEPEVEVPIAPKPPVIPSPPGKVFKVGDRVQLKNRVTGDFDIDGIVTAVDVAGKPTEFRPATGVRRFPVTERTQLRKFEEPVKIAERRATEFSKSRADLDKDLANAKAGLPDDLKARFGKGKFDFENKRLVSDDGTITLQWKMRNRPGEPISETNPQFSKGTVEIIDKGGKLPPETPPVPEPRGPEVPPLSPEDVKILREFELAEKGRAIRVAEKRTIPGEAPKDFYGEEQPSWQAATKEAIRRAKEPPKDVTFGAGLGQAAERGAYVLKPLMDMAKVEAATLIRTGKLKADQASAFIQRRINELIRQSREFLKLDINEQVEVIQQAKAQAAELKWNSNPKVLRLETAQELGAHQAIAKFVDQQIAIRGELAQAKLEALVRGLGQAAQKEFQFLADEVVRLPFREKMPANLLSKAMDRGSRLTRDNGPAGGRLYRHAVDGWVAESSIKSHGFELLDNSVKVLRNFTELQKVAIGKRIVRALENRKNAPSIMKGPEEFAAYESFRNFYDFYKKLLEDAGYKVREDYFTHIREMSFTMEEAMGQISSLERNRFSTLQKMVPKDVTSPFVKQRTEFLESFREDPWKVAYNYQNSVAQMLAYNKFVEYYFGKFLDDIPPVLRRGRAFSQSRQHFTNYALQMLKPDYAVSTGDFLSSVYNKTFSMGTVYGNFLNFNYKAAFVNSTQANFAFFQVSKPAKTMALQLFHAREKLSPNIANLLTEASQERSFVIREFAEGRKPHGRFDGTLEKIEPFRMKERYNWNKSHLAGMSEYAIRRGVKTIPELEKFLADPRRFKEAKVQAMDLAERTQLLLSRAARPEMIGQMQQTPGIKWLAMFKRFQFGHIENVARSLFPKGSKGQRAVNIERRAFPDELAPVEALRDLEFLRARFDNLVRLMKKKDPGLKEAGLDKVPIEVVREIRDALRAEEVELNHMIRQLEPTAGTPRQALNWVNVTAKVMGISFVWNTLYNFAVDTAYGASRRDTNLWAAVKNAFLNAVPFGFELTDPNRAYIPPLVSQFEFGFKRGVARLIPLLVPGGGPVNRFTGRGFTKLLEGLLGVSRGEQKRGRRKVRARVKSQRGRR